MVTERKNMDTGIVGMDTGIVGIVGIVGMDTVETEVLAVIVNGE